MRDIGNLKNRVEQLEYYATLNETERKTSEKVILDDDGLDKFKNGVLVDTFDGHNIGDVNSADYKVSIDRTYRYATAYANNQIQIGLKYSTTGSSNDKTVGERLDIIWISHGRHGRSLWNDFPLRQVLEDFILA